MNGERRKPSAAWWNAQADRLRLRKVGGELKGPCPNCGGRDRFWVSVRSEKAGLLGCRRCEPEINAGAYAAILQGAGWPSDAERQRSGIRGHAQPQGQAANSRWRYWNVAGETFDVVRNDLADPKQFWREPSGVKDPYLPLGVDLRTQVADGTVIVEGERCSDAVRDAGLPAMTWCGGTSSWRKTVWTSLQGKMVILWPDNDEPGRKAMSQLAGQLLELNCEVRMVRVPDDAPRRWDAADTDLDEIRTLVEAAEPWKPAIDFVEDDSSTVKSFFPDWNPADIWGISPEPIQWLVDNWLPAGRVAMLTGKGGAGKSKLALQLAVALASGIRENEWLEGVAPLAQGVIEARIPVVWATWEDPPEQLRISVDAWPCMPRMAMEDRNEWLAAELAMLRAYYLAGKGVLWEQSHGEHRDSLGVLTELGRQLRQECESAGARLLVIDPLSAAFGCNENVRSQVRAFIASWDAWAQKHDCAVLLISHPGKGTGEATEYSGSTDWRAAARALLKLTREGSEDSPRAKLELIKCNYAPAQSSIQLTLPKDGTWWWKSSRRTCEPLGYEIGPEHV